LPSGREYENKALTPLLVDQETETMIAQIRQVLHSSRDSLLYDFAGVLAIGVMTMGALHLPGLI
jgi:hypothetical protein